jgi:CubicO group peptidase (beta-lactamase class C family)
VPVSPAAVLCACQAVDAAVRSDRRYAHTNAFLVVLDDQVIYAARYRGPALADVFSVTKTVLATVVGVASRLGRLPALDESVDPYVRAACGVDLSDTPSAGQTWRHLLTMTRGAQVDGRYDLDEVTALPSGWVRRIAEAPRVDPPGRAFRYDNGAAHLLSAALTGALGEGVDVVAERELFDPLGIEDADWLLDPEGIAVGAGFLRLSAGHLATLGQLWLDGGRWRGRPLVDPAFLQAMLRRQSAGGPPEGCGYGFLTWIAEDHFFAGGWAGQHVMVVPAARAVIVVTGDPGFRLGPPPTDDLPPDWRPARDLVLTHLLPALHTS